VSRRSRLDEHLDGDAETPSITRLEGSRWRGGRLWSWNQDLRASASVEDIIADEWAATDDGTIDVLPHRESPQGARSVGSTHHSRYVEEHVDAGADHDEGGKRS
jgi:hypothetical protein